MPKILPTEEEIECVIKVIVAMSSISTMHPIAAGITPIVAAAPGMPGGPFSAKRKSLES